MKRLDRFILTAFIGPFIMILFVVIFILMMQFLWLYIDELVGKGLGAGVILEFMGWGCCTILPLALPLAVLLSSMMTLGQMAENNEMMAMKSAGISLGRIMAPLIAVALLISVGAFYTANNLVPMAYKNIYALREDISKTKDEIKIPIGTFYDGLEGYILRVGAQDSKTGMMRDVMIYNHNRGNGKPGQYLNGNTQLTLADSAMMKLSDNKDYITFTLFNGINYQETNEKKYSPRDTSRQLQKIDFDRQQLMIPLAGYSFKKTGSSDRYKDQVKAMRIHQLIQTRDSLKHLEDSLKDYRYKLTVADTKFIKRAQLDTSEHLNIIENYKSEKYLTWESKAVQAAAYERAANTAEDFATSLYGYSRESGYNLDRYRKSCLEVLRKFGQAIACFVLFFIGAPLGSLIRKGGLGTSAIVSILFFLLYYVIDTTGAKMAKAGSASAATGAFLASAVLTVIGAYFTWKAVRDESIFNLDGFGIWWRKIKSKFIGMFRKTRIVYMGTPEFAVAPLDKLIKNNYNVVGVVTVADKPSGRGLKVNESAVKKYAVEHGIPVLQPVNLRDPEFLEALKAWKADLFVVVAFRLLPEEVFTMPPLGTFNLHAALLPQYRGAAPINWAVINGEKITGVTTFMLDKGMDTGGIMLRQECRISDTDTAGTIHDKLMEIGADLVLQTTQGIIEKNIETRTQRSFIQGLEVLKPAPKITRETMHIDWTKSTKDVYNLIRGLSPYPAAYTEISKDGGEPVQMKIFETEKVEMNNCEPGKLISDGKSYIYICTGDGALSIKELQISGKKRMDVKTFLLGFRDIENYKTI